MAVVASSVSRLKALAENRLARLYGYENLWKYVEEITKTLAQLKKAHELIERHQKASCHLKSARHQKESFAKSQPSINKLLKQGNALLKKAHKSLTESELSITWLEQLCTKLQAELESVSASAIKTCDILRITYDCYFKLDQVYSWALTAMKYISQNSMDNYMTPEALELLATGLKSFMEQKTFIDDVVFDEISKQARFLSNRKLAERNKMAKRRYSETKNLLRTKYCLVDKKRLQIEEGSADLGSSESLVSAEKDRLGVHAADVHLHSSQSAPATPALALRGCNNHKDLNRRSQSLEDEDLPSVETEGSDGVDIGASAATGGAGFEDVANYSIGLEKTS
ncbi:hypothetical protein EB796_016120 [Bugula neritina]|uniref:Uncharacterized protein n=1 Tax=Bugula neritina TaxID=10212 RepID=A0A7J7JJM4_BUGNE|nr:hypothetical protein EB796_016120 [Bugula neritina]